MNPFVKQAARSYIESKLPEIIGFVATNVMHWIVVATPADIERVGQELNADERVKWLRMCEAVRKETP